MRAYVCVSECKCVECVREGPCTFAFVCVCSLRVSVCARKTEGG